MEVPYWDKKEKQNVSLSKEQVLRDIHTYMYIINMYYSECYHDNCLMWLVYNSNSILLHIGPDKASVYTILLVVWFIRWLASVLVVLSILAGLIDQIETCQPYYKLVILIYNVCLSWIWTWPTNNVEKYNVVYVLSSQSLQSEMIQISHISCGIYMEIVLGVECWVCTS